MTFIIKMFIFVTSEGQKYNYFCVHDPFRFVSQNTKQVHFRYIQIYRNYRIIIGWKFSRKIHSNSVFNQIFNYVQGTHCLTDNLVSLLFTVYTRTFKKPINFGRIFLQLNLYAGQRQKLINLILRKNKLSF